jgi:hypothetical protein
MDRVFQRNRAGLDNIGHEGMVPEKLLKCHSEGGAVTHDGKEQMALAQVNEGFSQVQTEIRIVTRNLARPPQTVDH